MSRDTAPNRNYRILGSALTAGISGNSEARLAYGYLWNSQGPDVKLGPNVGFKWRFLGNGSTNTSAAVSALYAINNGIDNMPHKNDYGALLMVSTPVSSFVLLGNFGHVWTGDPVPDLSYMSLAITRYVSRRTLVALEYSDLRRVGGRPAPKPEVQYALGVVYRPEKRWSYSVQAAYLPNRSGTRYHTTLGVSYFF